MSLHGYADPAKRRANGLTYLALLAVFTAFAVYVFGQDGASGWSVDHIIDDPLRMAPLIVVIFAVARVVRYIRGADRA